MPPSSAAHPTWSALAVTKRSALRSPPHLLRHPGPTTRWRALQIQVLPFPTARSSSSAASPSPLTALPLLCLLRQGTPLSSPRWPTSTLRCSLALLCAKASNCQFGRSFVCFLGHVISEHSVAVDPRKVSAVAEWATPTCCTDVCVASSVSLITTVSSFSAFLAWPPR